VLYIKLSTVVLLIVFFTSCASKKIEVVTDEKIVVDKPIELKILTREMGEKIVKEEKVEVKATNLRESEFLNILEHDTYASLCSSKSEYERVMLMPESLKKQQLVENLLLKYAQNLANGCINIKDMQRKIAKNRANKIKSSFKTYTQKVDKKKILEQYRSKQITLKKILEPYVPKHPDYFRFVGFLNDTTLSKQERHKLRLNIERLKLMKPYESTNFIQLNIPAYSFDFYENNIKSMSFGTVVGDLEDQTPVLSSKLSYFIMNPAWNIPDSIAKKTIIPRMLKDKKYLSKKGIVIHKNYNLSSKKFRQKDVKWDKYLKESVRYIPYKFIQMPSKTNGMGRVKFIFPNEYAVYMHDTIGTWRFKSPKQSIRAVSHGCVRLENPLALIKYISTHYTKKSYDTVKRDYDSQKMKTVSLSKKLPVHITYITAYIDKEKKLQFYKDLYGYDSMQKLNFSL